MKKLAALILLTFLIAFTANCDHAGPDGKKTSGKYASESRSDFGFREIKAGNAVILIITVQEEFNVMVEGDERQLKDVKTNVEGERLIVTTGGSISPENKVRLKISMPELTDLELWGASEATVAKANGGALKIQTGSTSRVKIDGEINSLTANANGTSWIDAAGLKAEKAEVRAAGSSEITVFVSGDLFAEAYGASTVFYSGEPKGLKQSVAGAGEIRKK